MKSIRPLLVLLALASSWANSQARSSVSHPPVNKPVVILITIDGFPARALEDQRLPMPTLRELARNGVQARGMTPINPTVTWPNHTTLITGVDASRHHVMANGLMVFPSAGGAVRVEPSVDKSILVHAPTLYDVAAQKGLTTGQVDWVAIAGARNVRWQFGERPDPQGDIAHDLITQHLVTTDELRNFGDSSPAWRDEIWTDAAIDILEHHTPDLLLVHLLDTDTLQHRYAPLTAAAYAAYAYADHCLSRIVAAVQQAGLEDRVTYMVVSDHGFSTYTHEIKPNAILRANGLLDDTRPQTVWVKAEGGHADVFLSKADNRQATIATLTELFQRTPGVEHVYTNQQAQALGLPAAGTTSQAPDLWLTAAPGYAFEDGDRGNAIADVAPHGQHGYPNSNDEMQALFIASGAHIRRGEVIPVFKNLQVAPTIAQILGLPFPQAQASPLLQILR